MQTITVNRSFAPILITMALCFGVPANGQTTGQAQSQTPSPRVEVPQQTASSIVGSSNMECAGYFRLPPLIGVPQIVGAQEEQEKAVYATGDLVYIDAGAQQGVKDGQEFHIIRPRGEIERVYRVKKGSLGVFVQEIGQLRVIKAKDNVSVAQITLACQGILLGDLLTGLPDRSVPDTQVTGPLNRFSDQNGKPIGRIMMARDYREMMAAGDIIYVDLGAEDKLVAGDYLTIYRELGGGNLFNVTNEELARRSDTGFGSEEFRGGTFSSQAQRSKDIKDDAGMYRHSPIKTSTIKDNRPPMPRKVVGEAMIINVQVRTATAIIMRSAQEVHTGDYVEVK